MKMWNACTMFNQAGLHLFLWLQNSSLSEVLQDERIKMFLCASSEVSQFPVCINQNQTQKNSQSPSLTHSFTHSLRQIDYILTSSESNPLLGLWSLWSSEAAWEPHQVSFMFLVEASWFWYQTHKLASCSDEEAPSLTWKSSPRHSWSTYDMAWSKLN